MSYMYIYIVMHAMQGCACGDAKECFNFQCAIMIVMHACDAGLW